MTSATLFGLEITFGSERELARQLASFLKDGKSHTIVTLNPEMVVQAQRDATVFQLLRKADLRICDGKGIALAARIIAGARKLTTCAGVDLIQHMLTRGCADFSHARYLFLGGRRGAASGARAALLKDSPHTNITVYGDSMEVDITDGHMLNWREMFDGIVRHINKIRPDVVLIAFGFPKQEFAIVELKPRCASVKIWMGVGGAFDFLSGQVRRAPRIMRISGLEWLWRLILEPQRLARIVNATFVFSRYVLRDMLNARFRPQRKLPILK